MAASDLLDAALVAKLAGSAALAVHLPDGIWLDEAPPGLERFGIVSLVEAVDLDDFGERAFEAPLYLVKAVTKGTDAAASTAAAALIDDLLDHQTMPVAGSPPAYAVETIAREGRLVPQVEVDDGDARLRWQHRGGYYRVTATAP